MYVYEKIPLTNASSSTSLGYWDVSGFSEVHLSYWFQGLPLAKATLTGYFEGLEGITSNVQIDQFGSVNVNAVYPIYGPNFHLVLYHPSAPMTGFVSFYLSCCGTAAKTPKSLRANHIESRRLKLPKKMILLPHRDWEPKTPSRKTPVKKAR
jgi:hypothetical protein